MHTVSRVIISYSIFCMERDALEALKGLFWMNAIILYLPREVLLVHFRHILALIGLCLATSLESIIFQYYFQYCLTLLHVLEIICQGTVIFIPSIGLSFLMKVNMNAQQESKIRKGTYRL